MHFENSIDDNFLGKQIYLRGLEEEDLVLRPKWFNSSEINKTLLMDYPITYASTLNWFRKSLMDNSKVNLSICDRENDKVIGMTGLLNINRRHMHAQFYITIGETEYWGRRIPDEVIPLVLKYGFAEQNLNKIYLWTIPENARARKVYERNGFVKEAEMKDHFYCRGRLNAIIQHRITRDEWSQIK